MGVGADVNSSGCLQRADLVGPGLAWLALYGLVDLVGTGWEGLDAGWEVVAIRQLLRGRTAPRLLINCDYLVMTKIYSSFGPLVVIYLALQIY